jgi:hypothetical protein
MGTPHMLAYLVTTALLMDMIKGTFCITIEKICIVRCMLPRAVVFQASEYRINLCFYK